MITHYEFFGISNRRLSSFIGNAWFAMIGDSESFTFAKRFIRSALRFNNNSILPGANIRIIFINATCER